MTILVSSVLSELIVMVSDRAVTDEQPQPDGTTSYEYEERKKDIVFPGACCITYWGDHYAGEKLAGFLSSHTVPGRKPPIDEIAKLTQDFLRTRFHKKDDLGFHVGGFDPDGTPRLFHVFWGFDIPQPADQTEPDARRNDHSDWEFVYNGRNDLADRAISSIQDSITARLPIRFNIKSPFGRIALCDFVARFAAEITPQVGPPFDFHFIFPGNEVKHIVHHSLSPISIQDLSPAMQRLAQIAWPSPQPKRPGAPVIQLGPPPPGTAAPTGTAHVG